MQKKPDYRTFSGCHAINQDLYPEWIEHGQNTTAALISIAGPMMNVFLAIIALALLTRKRVRSSFLLFSRTNLAWIVNAAGPEQAYSYEETVFDVKRREGSGMVAASNHFVDPTWHLTGTPDANSVTRFTNLVNQAGQSKGTIDVAKMVQIRNVLLQNGGATFLHYELGGDKYSTDHQVVFVPKTCTLHMKVVDRDWQKVDLKALFGA
ncbi:MAG: hypothetical protein Q7V05_09690 [Methanoregula sp.]|nr:hypothetical protein [Methanoregula sp.]